MRKLIKKQYGGGLMAPMQNFGSSSYNGAPTPFQDMMGKDWGQSLSNKAGQIKAPLNSMIDINAQMGDPTSIMLKGTRGAAKSPASSASGGLFGKANIGGTMNMAGQAADMIGSFIPKKEQSSLTTGLNTGYDAVADAAMAIPGVGTIVGGAMKVGGMLSDGLTAMGVGTDQMTTADKILDSKFLKLTPMGLVNAMGAKKTDTINKDEAAFAQVGSSYGGTSATVDNALTKSGKKYGTFSGSARNKANTQIHSAQLQQTKMGNIADEAKMAFEASNNPLLGMGTQLQLGGGYQQSNVRAGKTGLKLDKEFAKKVVKLSKGKKSQKQHEVNLKEIAEFKNGGAVNVIPDGALHAHKHHLEAVDDKFEEVTGKGIPVITEGNGGDITQHAEVEKEEIIFNLEITKQFEKLMEDGSDNAAIEAGKLLVYEILENTVDHTGILDKVE